jgi:hypothetical protein
MLTKWQKLNLKCEAQQARVGTKHEFVETADENDFRLVFVLTGGQSPCEHTLEERTVPFVHVI